MHPHITQPVADAVEAGNLSAIFDAIDEAIVHIDADWRVLFVNDVYLRMSGLNRSDVLNSTPFEFAPSFKKSIFYDPILRCQIDRKETRQISYSPVLNIWVRVRVVPYLRGSVLMISRASEDSVKDHLRAERAERDQLTGLGNKLAMEDQAGILLRRESPFSLVLLGIDDLKRVGDSHGYSAVDMAILQIASRLSGVLEDGDRVFRVNTDEFAFFLPDNADLVANKISKILSALRNTINLDSVRIILSGSVGVLYPGEDKLDFETMLKRSSLALAEARRSNGRRTRNELSFCVYRSELEQASQLRTELQDDLRESLEGENFSLLIQPKISLASGRVVGGEALIRWNHPRRGLLSPGVFLDLAREIGAMQRIDAWVLDSAAALAKIINDSGHPIPISLNLSADSVSDPDLPSRCQSVLDVYKIPANLLEIEIPEGSLVEDISMSTSILNSLNDLGVRLSIDDFGTGYSSFSYLAQFPVHTLKVDRSFINELQSSKPNRTIVQSIIKLAHHLSLDVVAEGAESDEQVAILKRMNCDNVQGYVFAKPMPVGDFLNFCDSRAHMEMPDPMIQ